MAEATNINNQTQEIENAQILAELPDTPLVNDLLKISTELNEGNTDILDLSKQYNTLLSNQAFIKEVKSEEVDHARGLIDAIIAHKNISKMPRDSELIRTVRLIGQKLASLRARKTKPTLEVTPNQIEEEVHMLTPDMEKKVTDKMMEEWQKEIDEKGSAMTPEFTILSENELKKKSLDEVISIFKEAKKEHFAHEKMGTSSKDLESLNEYIEQLQSHIIKISEKPEEKTPLNTEKIKSEMQEAEAERDKAKQQAKEYKGKIDKLKKDIKQAKGNEQQIQHLRDEISKLKQLKKAIDAIVKEKNTKLKALRKQNPDIAAKLDILEAPQPTTTPTAPEEEKDLRPAAPEKKEKPKPKNLKEKVETWAPKEYKTLMELHRVFSLYQKLPTNEKEKSKFTDERKKVFDVKDTRVISHIVEEIRQSRWNEFLRRKDPNAAFSVLYQKIKIDEQNAKEKLQQEIDGIKKVIENGKKKGEKAISEKDQKKPQPKTTPKNPKPTNQPKTQVSPQTPKSQTPDKNAVQAEKDKEKRLNELRNQFAQAINSKDVKSAERIYREAMDVSMSYAAKWMMKPITDLKAGAEVKMQTSQPNTTTPTPKPKATPAPKPKQKSKSNLDIAINRLLGNSSEKQKILLKSFQEYASKNPNDSELLFKTFKLLSLNLSGDSDAKKLKDEINGRFSSAENMVNTSKKSFPEMHIKTFFDSFLKVHASRIDAILKKHETKPVKTKKQPQKQPQAQQPSSAQFGPVYVPQAQEQTSEPQLTTTTTTTQTEEQSYQTEQSTQEVQQIIQETQHEDLEDTEDEEESQETIHPKKLVKEAKKLGLTPETLKMLDTVIPRKQLEANRPVAKAIGMFVKEGLEKNSFTMDELTQFLQNPEFLKKNINYEWLKDDMQSNKEVTDISVEDYQAYEQKLNDEYANLGEYLDSIKGQRMTNKGDSDKRQSALNRRMEITQLKREVSAAIKFKSSRMKYDSSRDVLGLIKAYTYKEGEGGIGELAEEIRKTVNIARKETDSWSNKISKILFFLKPSLGSTLTAIGKDVEFSGLGDDPGKKLAELAKFKIPFGTERIDKWIADIGGIEKHINSTIPRLIAYLEASIREGKASSLLIRRRARKLVEHLVSIQTKYIKNKIDTMSGKTTREKMMLYLDELRKVSHHEAEINKKLIRNNIIKSSAVKGAVVAGTGVAITAGVMASAPVVAGAIGALGLTGLTSRLLSNKPLSDDEKIGLKRGLKRAGVATTIGLAGALVGGLALPIGLGAAALGVASPEIWKHKKEIGKGAGTGLMYTGKAVTHSSIWAMKYLTPLNLYYGPKWLFGGKKK